MEDESLELDVIGHRSSENQIQSIVRAEIDMKVATAKQYPRVLSRVKQDMLSFATLDEETASACFYTLPRGGKTIQGPSVRLAEIAISSFGNISAGTRVLSVDASSENPHVTIQSVCHDMQNNVTVSIEKRRAINAKKNKDGTKKPISDDDIQLAVNACSAVAFRDAAFKVIPQALIKPVFDAAKRMTVGDVKSLSVNRQKIVDRLKQMGATEDRILAVVEARKIDDITVERLEILIGLGTSIRDGQTTIEKAFPPIEQEQPERGQSAELKLPRKKRESKEEKPADAHPELQPEPPKAPEQKPEPPPQSDTESGIKSTFRVSMESAGVTLDDIKDVAAMRPQLAPRSMEWNDWTDISDDDCKFIIENVSAENGTIKWKKR